MSSPHEPTEGSSNLPAPTSQSGRDMASAPGVGQWFEQPGQGGGQAPLQQMYTQPYGQQGSQFPAQGYGAVSQSLPQAGQMYTAPNGSVMPVTMYGFDPVTGLPFSDKSKTTAVLLSFFLGNLGVGRFYKGNTGLGIAMLLLSWATLGLWALVDTFVIGLGSPKDKYGRPLR